MSPETPEPMTATEGRAAVNPSGDWFTVLIASPWLEGWRGLAVCPHELESSGKVIRRLTPGGLVSRVCLMRTLRMVAEVVKG